LENKSFDDNGDLVSMNADEEFYDGEDICRAVNLEAKEVFNEWRDKEYEWDETVDKIN
jgi:hypothetical protein